MVFVRVTYRLVDRPETYELVEIWEVGEAVHFGHAHGWGRPLEGGFEYKAEAALWQTVRMT